MTKKNKSYAHVTFANQHYIRIYDNDCNYEAYRPIELLHLLNNYETTIKYLEKELKEANHDYKRADESRDEWHYKYVESEKENQKLKQELRLVLHADSITPHDSVQEILREHIQGLDTVTYESAAAWNDYCILTELFRKQYKEHYK